MSTVAFALSILISVLALAALAGMVHDLVRALDEDDETCSRIDMELDAERDARRAMTQWRGGWRN